MPKVLLSSTQRSRLAAQLVSQLFDKVGTIYEVKTDSSYSGPDSGRTTVATAVPLMMVPLYRKITEEMEADAIKAASHWYIRFPLSQQLKETYQIEIVNAFSLVEVYEVQSVVQPHSQQLWNEVIAIRVN